MKLERLLELANISGSSLNETVNVTHAKDSIKSLKDKLKNANVNTGTMTDEMI